MLFNILKIATLLCASSAFVKAGHLTHIDDVVTHEDDALSQLADQMITLQAPAHHISAGEYAELPPLFKNCGCATSGLKFWHADIDKVGAALAKGEDIWLKPDESHFFDPRTVGLSSKIGLYMKETNGVKIQLTPALLQGLVTQLKEKRDGMSCGQTGYNIYCELAFMSISFYAL